MIRFLLLLSLFCHFCFSSTDYWFELAEDHAPAIEGSTVLFNTIDESQPFILGGFGLYGYSSLVLSLDLTQPKESIATKEWLNLKECESNSTLHAIAKAGGAVLDSPTGPELVLIGGYNNVYKTSTCITTISVETKRGAVFCNFDVVDTSGSPASAPYFGMAYSSFSPNNRTVCGLVGIHTVSNTILGGQDAWCWDNMERKLVVTPVDVPLLTSPATLSLPAGGGAIIHGGTMCTLTDQLCSGSLTYPVTYHVTGDAVQGLSVRVINEDGPTFYGGSIFYDAPRDQLVLAGGYNSTAYDVSRNSAFFTLERPFELDSSTRSWVKTRNDDWRGPRNLAGNVCLSTGDCYSYAGTSAGPSSSRYVTTYYRRYSGVYHLTEEDGEPAFELIQREPPSPGLTTAVTSTDGRSIYAMGGWSPYRPALFRWNPQEEWRCMGNCPDGSIPRQYPESQLYRPVMASYAGHLYLFDSSRDTPMSLLRIDEADMTQPWEVYDTLPAGAVVQAAGIAHSGDGAFYIFGGTNHTPSDALVHYDIPTRTYTRIYPEDGQLWPAGCSQATLVAFPFESRIAPTPRDISYASASQADPSPRGPATSLFLIGGYNDRGCVASFWRYDIGERRWYDLTTASTPIFCFTKGVVWEDKLIFVDGRTGNLGEVSEFPIRPNMMIYDFLRDEFLSQALFTTSETAATSPSMRYDHAFAPYAQNGTNGMVGILMGGISDTGLFYNDQWFVKGNREEVLSYSLSEQMPIIGVAAVIVVLICIVIGIFLCNKMLPVVKAASLSHSMAVLLGCTCLAASGVCWVLFPNKWSCWGRLVLLFEGISLITSSLYSKLTIVGKIFNSEHVLRMSRVRTVATLPVVLLFVVWDAIALLVWFLLSQPGSEHTINDYAQPLIVLSETEVMPVCRAFLYHPELFLALLLLWKAVFVLWGTGMSIISRDIVNAFNEARSLRFGVFVLLLVMLVSLESLLMLPSLYESQLSIAVLTQVLSGTLLVVLFANKIYYIYKFNGRDPIDMIPQSTNMIHSSRMGVESSDGGGRITPGRLDLTVLPE
eukprot:gnl/Dysnectes_brevis/3879_a5015_517.p1 GENE.gnl/Dysnectes_brevis/3879_a5015_517~~gnl/Dysnectes_brevis/3879_a5015_517.p1  ORF type:complete len:1047 (-),score=372.30 gnl/Dysnectes_brevis/3879_a5015_517:108-3248(-)